MRAWKGTIREQHKQISRLLRKNPSLKPYFLQILTECYSDAREITLDKTGLTPNCLPTQPLIQSEDILNEDWLSGS